MKRVLLPVIAIVSFALAIVSCQKAPFLTMNGPRSITFTREGGTQSFSFTCNRDWSVSSSESWIQVSPSSGTASDGEVTVKITCAENTTYDPRNTTIMVRVEELMETISVSQDMNLGLMLSPTIFDLSDAKQNIEVEVQKNVQYTVIIDDSCANWISLVDTKGLSTDKLTFNIKANVSYDTREGKVSISSTTGNLLTELVIKQDRTHNIIFEDPIVKQICVSNFDNNRDGELSFDEAASVKSIALNNEASIFTNFLKVKKFNELQYFSSLTEIPDFAFVGTALEEISLPESIVRIGICAFSKALIEEIILPDSIKKIDSFAFGSCIHLKEFVIPPLVEDIVSTALQGSGITSIQTRASVIGGCSGCKYLKEVIIPENVTKICAAAFSNCPISRIVIPQSVQIIQPGAFYGCEELMDIVIENQVIGENMFFGCAIESYVIPEYVTTIGGGAFANCNNLTSITLPSELKQLNAGMFAGCKNLSSITLPSAISEIPDMTFQDCSNLSEVILQGTIVSIGEYAFSGCSKINDFIIPETVTSLGSRAFFNSSIENVILPENLQSIGWGCFELCPLSRIICKATEPPVLEHPHGVTFNGGYYPIYVHSSSFEKYKADSKWSWYDSRLSKIEDL